MRDGVRLSANIFLPSEHARVPAILVRTPYGKGADITANYQAFVEHGYAVVIAEDATSSTSAEMHAFSMNHIMPRIARVSATAEIELNS